MFRHPKQIFTKIVRSIPISHQFLPYIPRNTVASLAMSFAVKPFDDIIVIPVQCLTDNYSYILQDVSTGTAAVVDPVEPAKLKAALETAHIPLSNVEMILTTHKHWDHASGNKGMLELAPHASIYMGPEEGTFEFPKTVVNDGEELALGNLSIRVLHTPCHTSGHVCYLVNKGEEQLLFSGDTLFVGGCGRFFEGSAENMFPNMQKVRFIASVLLRLLSFIALLLSLPYIHYQ